MSLMERGVDPTKSTSALVVGVQNFDAETGEPVRSECYACGGRLDIPPVKVTKTTCKHCLRHTVLFRKNSRPFRWPSSRDGLEQTNHGGKAAAECGCKICRDWQRESGAPIAEPSLGDLFEEHFLLVFAFLFFVFFVVIMLAGAASR